MQHTKEINYNTNKLRKAKPGKLNCWSSPYDIWRLLKMKMYVFYRLTLPLYILRKRSTEEKAWTFRWNHILKDTDDFEGMCLATFMSEYKVTNESVKWKTCTFIKLQDGLLGSIRKRKKHTVVRYLKVKKSKDSERHYENQLRMYMPHRGKEMRPPSYLTFESFITTGETVSVQEIVSKNLGMYEKDSEIVDEAWESVKKIVWTLPQVLV